MASFDITKKLDDTNKNNKIVYDYNNIEIKNSDITFDKKTGNFKIPVTFPVNIPNVTYPNSLSNYNAKTIYISNLVHNNITNLTDSYKNIANVNTDSIMGELIIEHTKITGYGNLYTCFFLKFVDSTTDTNDLDNLLNMYNNEVTSVQFNLNKILSSQDYGIVYNVNKLIDGTATTTTTAMVFVTPIYLNKKSYSIFVKNIYNKSGLNKMSIYDVNYIVLPKANISQRGEEEIYIDCTPTGESAETIATYNVPIQSEYTRDWGKLDFMKMTIQLLMVFILLLTTYFGVPIMYKRVVVDNINRLISDNNFKVKKLPENTEVNVGKHIRNTSVDRYLLFFSSLIIGFSFLFSISSKNYNYLQYTIYLFIFGILSVAIVGFNKSSGYFNEGYIKKDLFDREKFNKEDVDAAKFKDFFWKNLFLSDTVSFLAEAFGGNDSKKDIKNLGIVLGFLTFTYIFLIIFRWGIRSINHSTFLFLCWFFPIFVVIPSSLIAVLNLYKLDTNPIPKS
jgi:hypothetical protein